MDKLDKKREFYGKVASIVGIITNIFLASLKIIIGAIFGFVSVLADGLNNLSDCGSSVVSLISFKLSSKPADKEHPYGHERIEYISSMIVAFVILIIAFELVKESIEKIINPQLIEFSFIVIITLIISIFTKILMFIYYKKVAKKINSDLLNATAIDCLSDSISTTAVLISVVIGKLFSINLDAYISIVVSILIAWSGIKIIKECSSKLIGQAPDESLIQNIKKRILKHEQVLGVHDLNVYSFGPNKFYASVHIEIDAETDVLTSHELIDEIEREFALETNILLTGHHDPIVTNDEEVNQMREIVKDIVDKIDKSFSMHDFRMVKGVNFTNIIFDVAIPLDCKKSEHEITNEIKQQIAEVDSKYRPVITLEKQLFKL